MAEVYHFPHVRLSYRRGVWLELVNRNPVSLELYFAELKGWDFPSHRTALELEEPQGAGTVLVHSRSLPLGGGVEVMRDGTLFV